MSVKSSFLFILLSTLLFSCVSSKKFKSLNADNEALKTRYSELEKVSNQCQTDVAGLKSQNESLNRQISDQANRVQDLKTSNSQVLQQLETMSVLTKEQSESIKKSMENIGAKDAYIQTLQQQMAYKDSLNMALVMNLKGAIGNLEDEDINIKIDKGVVIIDISDKLLFKSGSYDVTDKAKGVLDKVAKVLKNQPDLQFMVEGHTDNVPYKGNKILKDNWDLSVKRATTIVRLLQTQYGLDPKKMVAAGRGEYNPVVENSTAEGKAANRRTRIVILPELDQFFKLLETKKEMHP